MSRCIGLGIGIAIAIAAVGTANPVKSVQRQRPPRCFRRQKKKLVQTLFGHDFQQRKHGAHGFANARSGLGHQAFARQRGFVHRCCQLPLAWAKCGVHKRQACQRNVARRTVRQLDFSPG